MHLSQPALTQALRQLEHEAGQRLFERGSSGIAATEAGKLLLIRMGRAFELLRSCEKELGTGSRSRLPRVTATQLKALLAVVETGGYSLAARELGLAQPSVYRAAKSLEALCGETLFQRTPRGVEPSARARRLARLAGLAFSEIRQGFEEVQALGGRQQSRIRIGCLPLARTRIVPDAVNRVLTLYPELKISIVDGPYDELLQALRYGRLELIIGALRSPAPGPDIVQEALFSDPLAVVVRAGHPLLKGPAPRLRQLSTLDWISPRPGTPARDHFAACFAANGLELPQHFIECSSLVATRGLLRGSDRAALLSARQVCTDVAAGQLALLLETLPGTERAIGLTTRRNWQPTAVLERFLLLLRESASERGDLKAAHITKC